MFLNAHSAQRPLQLAHGCLSPPGGELVSWPVFTLYLESPPLLICPLPMASVFPFSEERALECGRLIRQILFLGSWKKPSFLPTRALSSLGVLPLDVTLFRSAILFPLVLLCASLFLPFRHLSYVSRSCLL